MTRPIGLLGEYNPNAATHMATETAIRHSRAQLGVEIESIWVSTDDIDRSLFERCSAILVAPGSPYKNMQNVLWAIRTAREKMIPCLGTCGGFQHMVIEYARNVLGVQDAQHAEYDPDASDLFISRLACSLVGREMTLMFAAQSQVAAIYGTETATEQYYCQFGVNPDYLERLRSGPLRITGSDAEGEARVVELPGHPFFVGTLFVPQSGSTPERPHPLVTAFLRAAVGTGTATRDNAAAQSREAAQ